MLTPTVPRAWVDPIMTVGDDIGAYQFESIPDGIAIRKASGHGKAEVYVNHETSTVPFPYVATGPTAANSQNDFDNAQVSKLIIDTDDASVLQASMAITSAEGYQRFCSNFLATKAHGFSRELLFTNEEAVDWVKRSGPPFWPTIEGADDSRQRASSWPSTRRPANDDRSGAWVATTTRTAWRCPATRSRSSSRVTTPSSTSPRSHSSSRTSPRTRTRSGTTRAICGRSCWTIRGCSTRTSS